MVDSAFNRDYRERFSGEFNTVILISSKKDGVPVININDLESGPAFEFARELQVRPGTVVGIYIFGENTKDVSI